MVRNYLSNLLLYSENDFVDFLKSIGLFELIPHVEKAVDNLLKKCCSRRIAGSDKKFVGWLTKEMLKYQAKILKEDT